MSTPPSMRASGSLLAPPSPLAQSTKLEDEAAPADPLADVPDLQNYITADVDEKTAALKLVADSVAQMRQTASTSLIFHPLNVAAYVAVLAVLYNLMVKSSRDLGLFATTAAGITMAFLIGIRAITGPFLELAENVKADLLDNADVFIAKFGDEVIGTIILAWIPADSKGKRRKGWRAEIKGWAVRIRYRGKGVGLSLLEDAVEEARKKGAESVEFSEDLPNLQRVLWPVYNAPFDKRDRRASKALDTIWTKSKSKKR